MIDVREIKLSMRYPESRQEDITDAFTRGYTGAVEIGNKAIKKLETENAKLRETCLDAHEWMGRALYDGSARRYEYESITERMRELGVEVEDE